MRGHVHSHFPQIRLVGAWFATDKQMQNAGCNLQPAVQTELNNNPGLTPHFKALSLYPDHLDNLLLDQPVKTPKRAALLGTDVAPFALQVTHPSEKKRKGTLCRR